MPVEDVFSIQGRGTVATVASSRVSSRGGCGNGIVPTQKTTVTGVEMFRRASTRPAGDNCGLSSIAQARPGAARSGALQAGSITPHKKFEAEIYASTRTRRRHTPFFSNYRPSMRTADITGNINVPEGTEMVMLGDNVTGV